MQYVSLCSIIEGHLGTVNDHMTLPLRTAFQMLYSPKLPNPRTPSQIFCSSLLHYPLTYSSSPFALILDYGPRMYRVLTYISREKVFETFKVPKLSNLTSIFQPINFTDLPFALKDIQPWQLPTCLARWCVT